MFSSQVMNILFRRSADRKRSHRNAKSTNRKGRRLRIEGLESRSLLSAVPLAPVTVALTEIPNGQTDYGQIATFSVQVAPGSGATGTPSGIVEFMDGSVDIANRTLDSNGNAKFATGALAVGSHTITADYSGDRKFAEGTSNSVVEAVNAATTTTTVDALPSTSSYGRTLHLTAFVAVDLPGRGPLSGTVTFLDGTTSLGTASVGPGGFATLNVAGLAVGSHSITASFDGDSQGDYAPSVSEADIVRVGKGVTATALTISAHPTVVGQSVTFTAQVSTPLIPAANASDVTPPSGEVNFLVDGVVVGSGPLDSTGKATFSTSALTLGRHAIYAVYQGDANYIRSASALHVERVVPATAGIATGNGSIHDGVDKFNFSVQAAYDADNDLVFSGNLTFIDTTNGDTFTSTAINSLVIGP
ncbi:MAG: Ig-like domain-containing protein, partial [Thermoguttaceae bacterium]